MDNFICRWWCRYTCVITQYKWQASGDDLVIIVKVVGRSVVKWRAATSPNVANTYGAVHIIYNRPRRRSSECLYSTSSFCSSRWSYRLSTFGRWAYSVAGLTVWNSLLDSCRDPALSSSSFRPISVLLHSTHRAVEMLHDCTLCKSIIDVDILETHLFSAYQHI